MANIFVLKPLPPFRLDLTVWALRRRARNIIDRCDGTTYSRVLSLGDVPLEIEVRQATGGAWLSQAKWQASKSQSFREAHNRQGGA